MEKQMPPCANSWRNCSIGRNHPSLWFRDRLDAIKSSKFRTFPCRKPQPSSEINKSPSEENLCDPIAKTTRKKNTRNSPSTHSYQRSVQPLRFCRKGDQKFRERGEREGRRTAFQSGFRLSQRRPEKRTLGLLPQLIHPEGASSLCDSVAKATRSLGKEGSARGENRFSKRFSPLAQKHIQIKKRDAKKQPLQPSPHRVNYFADFSVFPEPAGAWQEYARPHRNFPTTDEWDAATGR